MKTLKDIYPEDYDVMECRKEAIKRTKAMNTGGFTFNFDYEGKVKQWFKKKEKLQVLDYVNLGGMIEFINFLI